MCFPMHSVVSAIWVSLHYAVFMSQFGSKRKNKKRKRWYEGKRWSKEGVDFFFSLVTLCTCTLTLTCYLFKLQVLKKLLRLSLEEVDHKRQKRRNQVICRDQWREVVFAVLLLRDLQCHFFSSIAWLLAKDVLLDSLTAPCYGINSFSCCISDRIFFFSQLPNLY